jgi:hypothetical protein
MDRKTSHRDKRGITNGFRDNSIHCSPSWNKYRVVANHVTAKNLTRVVEGTSDKVNFAIKDMQRCLSFLACMVTDHCVALDFLLARQGGVCAIAILPVAHM